MANNPYVNKVVFGNMTLIDTSNVTVTPDKLAEGYTALDASGALITGTAKTGGGNTVYYGECATGAGTAAKTVTIDGITELTEGLSIRVKFTNAQTYNGAPTLNLNSLGAKNICRNGTTNAARYEWLAGEVLDLVYDGDAWLMVNGGVATTTYYGQTKLQTSGVGTSAGYALTPASLNSLAQNMLAGVGIYSTSSTYAVGDRVRYSYSIWECNTAITTAEAWNAAHWTELPSLQEQIDDIDELPAVAAADNGKVLRVVNGAWAAAALPVYNGGVI